MSGAAANNSSTEWEPLSEDMPRLTQFEQYYLPVLIILGALSNFIIFKAMLSDRLCSGIHTAVFVFGLALVDLSFLSVLTVMWLRTIDVDFYNRPGWCQTWTLISFLCEFLTIWFTTGLVVESLLVVKWKLRIVPGGWFPAWRPKFFALTVTIIGVVVYMNITLLFGVTNAGGKCLPLPMYVNQIKLLNEVDVFINVLIPYVIIMVCVCLIVSQLIRQTVTRLQGHVGGHYSTVHAESNPGNGMVLWVAVVFFVCTAPGRLIRFWQTISDLVNGHQLYHRNGSLVLAQHAFLQLSFSRCILNFMVYLLTWRPFRKYVIHCSCPAAHEYEEPGDVLEMETEMDFVSTAVENSDNELTELEAMDKVHHRAWGGLLRSLHGGIVSVNLHEQERKEWPSM